jgi:hypothetical protein
MATSSNSLLRLREPRQDLAKVGGLAEAALAFFGGRVAPWRQILLVSSCSCGKGLAKNI